MLEIYESLNSSDVYFRRITFTDGVRPAAFFYCKSVSEKSSGGMDVFYHDFNVMKYVPKSLKILQRNSEIELLKA